MKIAVIGSKGLPPRQGGIEHHCAEIYSRIAAEGHQVEVFARSSYNHLPWNARYFYNDVQVSNIPSLPLRGIDALVNSGLAAVVASLRQFDIIHFHALGPALFSWVPRILSPRTKVVVTCHGLDWQRAKWGKTSTQLIKLGEKSAVRSAHEIAVVSEDLQRYFWDRYERRTTYISNAPASYPATDSAFAFGQSQGLAKGRYILFLGRLVPEKCPDLLVKAFLKLLPKDWKLALVGGASDTSSYTKELYQLANSSQNIVFCGELQGKQLAEIVRGAGLFILPSAVEGLPLALLEAMREGIPVIASDIPIHQKILDGDRGLLFRQDEVDDCTAAIDWATQNSDLMQVKAEKAKQYIQVYHNWDYIARDWLTLYEQLLATSSSAKALSSSSESGSKAANSADRQFNPERIKR